MALPHRATATEEGNNKYQGADNCDEDEGVAESVTILESRTQGQAAQDDDGEST